MSFVRDRLRRGPWVPAAAAALLCSSAGCDLGGGRLHCTLDPAELEVGAPGGCSAPGVMAVTGRAFPWGECGVACPRPWTVTVRWTNRTTGASGAQVLGWQTSGCWPFAATSCHLEDFGFDVPVAPGTNLVELEADEGDGFTACRTVELVAPPAGC